VLPQKVEITPGLFLLGSRLGWILTGRLHTENTNKCVHSLLALNWENDCITRKTRASQCSHLENKQEVAYDQVKSNLKTTANKAERNNSDSREQKQTRSQFGRIKVTENPKVGNVVQIKENCA